MYYVYSDFLGQLMGVIQKVISSTLVPILIKVYNTLLSYHKKLIMNFFGWLILRIWLVLLKLVSFFEVMFNAFAGIKPIEITRVDATGTAVAQKITLLEYLYSGNQMTRIFAIFTAVSVLLCFFATVIATIRSIDSMLYENKKPISTVLRSALQASLRFLLIPICCLFMIQMTGSMLRSMKYYFATESNVQENGKTVMAQNDTIAGTMFLTVAASHVKNGENLSKYTGSSTKYLDPVLVGADFNYKEFDYFQAVISVVIIVVLLLASSFQAISQILNILVLYLAAPFFVSTYPLDEGARFKKWQNRFIAMMIAGMGPIFAMNLYLILMPVITSNSLNLGFMDLIERWFKLFFLIGGAVAVHNARNLLVQIVDPELARHLNEQSGFIGKAVGNRLVGETFGRLKNDMENQAKHGGAIVGLGAGRIMSK